MKPDSPDSPVSNKPAALTGNETQVIDLSEVELLVAQHAAAAPPSERSLPPPLPPTELARASALPPSMSMAPPEVVARGNVFYVVAILAFLVIGIGGGLVIAKTLSTPSPGPPDPIHVPASAAVITIPTVEMNDTDAGK